MENFIINETINSRFLTMETNIKSKSNSYYDSYLDLLEGTIKYILDDLNIQYDKSKTCGYIIRGDKIEIFFKNQLKLDDHTYEKLIDYIKKCNDHKHKKEKNLEVETIINHLRIYFILINSYLSYKKHDEIKFDSNYFNDIFGENERVNKALKNEVIKLTDELKESYEQRKLSEVDLVRYAQIIKNKNLKLQTLDLENNYLKAQIEILKDIKLNSMENKLNKTLDMLANMKEYLIESRAATRIVAKMINGKDLTDDIIKEEKERIEGLINNDK